MWKNIASAMFFFLYYAFDYCQSSPLAVPLYSFGFNLTILHPFFHSLWQNSKSTRDLQSVPKDTLQRYKFLWNLRYVLDTRYAYQRDMLLSQRDKEFISYRNFSQKLYRICRRQIYRVCKANI